MTCRSESVAHSDRGRPVLRRPPVGMALAVPVAVHALNDADTVDVVGGVERFGALGNGTESLRDLHRDVGGNASHSLAADAFDQKADLAELITLELDRVVVAEIEAAAIRLGAGGGH